MTNIINQNAQIRLEQNEIIIQDLLNKLQENQMENQRYKDYCEDLERRLEMRPAQANGKIPSPNVVMREPFVDIDAIELCANIEKALLEANSTLNEATFKKTMDKLLLGLYEMVLKQYSTKDVSRLIAVKDSLANKFDSIQKRLNSYNDLNEKHNRLKSELGARKVSTDSAQTELISIEVEQSRKDMEVLQSKVIDQNRTIKRLVAQVERLFVESNFSNYECPICHLEVTNDINFDVFKHHVSKCDKNKHSCMFCLKVFDQNEYDAYIQHVQNEHN
jgi:hypothetical protein